MSVRRRFMGKSAGWDAGLKNGLYAMYQLNGNPNDDIKGNHLSSTNVTYSQGLMKQCALLQPAISGNTVNRYLYRASGLSIYAPFSISMWIKRIAITGQFDIMFIITNNAATIGTLFRFVIERSTGSVSLYNLGSNNYYSWGNTNAIVDNTWTHIVLSFTDAPNSFAMVNGIVASGSSYQYGTVNSFDPTPVYISSNVANWVQYTLNGNMEQLAFWSRAISQAEALKIYNTGKGLPF